MVITQQTTILLVLVVVLAVCLAIALSRRPAADGAPPPRFVLSANVLLRVAGLVCFILATVGVASPVLLVPLGLACWLGSSFTS